MSDEEVIKDSEREHPQGPQVLRLDPFRLLIADFIIASIAVFVFSV